ncbi:retrovirus-related pol polyprotein from transposon TNT 1-94 [Tanacetum coccineum]
MTTLADKAILSGADNRPPMMEKDMYDSWKSIMELYMMNRQHGRMIFESVENGPLIWPTIEENGVTRPRKYSELTPADAIQADCDVKATNIILQGLPPEVYALVSNHRIAKELWERIQLLMQGTSLTKQERECKLYDEFDKFAYKKGETLRDFYLRFSLLLNDMNIYNVKLEQFQVNTKFLNTLPPEWSKFVTDVKLVWDLHTTNIDQLHAYLGQHEFHANKVRLMHELSPKEPTKKSAKAKKDVPSTKKPATKPKLTKKKAHVKADRGKGLNILSKVALSEVAQLKKVTKRSKKDFHISYTSESGDETDFESRVPDEQHRMISGTDKGTGTKPGVSDVPKYDSESEKESWGDSREEDDDDDNTKDKSDNDGNYDDGDNDGSDDDGDNYDNDDDKEEEEESERVYTPPEFVPTHDEENINDEEKMDEEEDDDVTKELYKDVEEDARVTLTLVHDIHKTKGLMQSSSVSSDFTDKLLNFENTSPIDNEIASLMDTLIHHEEPSRQTSSLYTVPIMVILEIMTTFTTTIPSSYPSSYPLLQQATPTPTLTASKATTSFPALPDFSSVFRFNKRVINLEKDLLKMKQVDQYAQTISSTLAIVNHYIDNKQGEAIQQAMLSLYILPQAVLEFATPVIEQNVIESLEAVVLEKSSSQPKSTYDAAASLSESRDDKDKDQDPSARSDRGMKRRKSSKDVESSRDPKSKESKSSTSSKGTSRSQHKSSGKSAHVEEQSHTVDDSGVRQNQEFDTGNNDEQPDDEAVSKSDCYKKPEQPPTPNPDWNKRQHVRPAFNLLKVTCKSRTELEYHFKESFKATSERLDWHNPKGKQYPLDLRKPLPLIPDRLGRQVIPQDYFINNDFKYLKGGSLSRQYSTSVTKTKAVIYEVKWIEDTVPNLWSPIKAWYDYGHLDEIEVRREDQELYKFKEGDFPRLHLQDIKDMLLLLVQQKLTNIMIDKRYDLNVALRKVFTNIGYTWRPTGRTFTIVGNACPLTRITTTAEVPLRKPTAQESVTPKPVVTLVYSRKPRKSKTNVPVSKPKIIKSISANNKEPSKSWGSIVFDVPSSSLDECMSSKLFSGTVKFRNDHVAKILGYGDYHIGNVTISRVYYVEGLGHNLFSVGQFCDSNLEVAFRQHTCFIRNLEGVDLLTGSRGNNLYTLSLRDMMASSPICLLSKASKTKSWLWHRRLSHLNFGAINHLARHGLVRGLPKLKFEKDHLCSACAMGKSKKKPHKPKSEDTNQEKLYLLHMDLCGPMRVASVNGKKYILVIVDDYSRFTWVKCLRSKDEAPDFIIKFLKMIQVRLKVPVRRIRTDNGTEFVNQTLREYYEKVGISHETYVARSPQQNGVVERRNRTLIEVARTMLIYAKASLFLWAEAVATNKDKKNRLMRIDELNKFSDGTLNDVWTALNDRLKGIRMEFATDIWETK